MKGRILNIIGRKNINAILFILRAVNVALDVIENIPIININLTYSIHFISFNCSNPSSL
jgi:hypothetical protein